MLKLGTEFLERYKYQCPNWGPLGWVTYVRTYSRWLESEGRREEWWETVRRVVEGDLGRMELAGDRRPADEKLAEAERLYHYIYNFGVLVSGRNFWMSGTEYEAQRGGDALVNCWWIPIRPFYGRVSYPFTFMMDRLMTGGGVGYGVRKQDIRQIPTVRNRVWLSIMCRPSHPNFDPKTMTSRKYRTQRYLRVPDTREGWCEALRQVIDAHFDGAGRLYIDVSDVRPYGAPIRGFGGTASGPGPLVTLLLAANATLNARVGGSLTSVDCLDLGNYVGRCVVSGNVRRSAEIAIGDADDVEFVQAKRDREALYSHRWASNNTVMITADQADFSSIAESIADNGEPGVFNIDLARHYGRIMDGRQENADPEADGLNPCGEITLAPGEPCNLCDVNPLVIHRDGAALGLTYEEALRLAARYTYRVTCAPYNHQLTRDIIARNRRTGVALTGVQDWILARFGRSAVQGFTEDGEPIFDSEVLAVLDGFYRAVQQANDHYATELGLSPSIKKTTVKPSGTVSLLAGVSPGVHAPYSAYYIRRIRFQQDDPLVKLLRLCGYPVEPDAYAPNTVVAEFPVISPAATVPGFTSADALSIEEQFAFQYLLAYAWADNAVSCTIAFKDEEKPKIAGLLRQYRDRLKSTSLLPYSGHGYVQAPYEPISQQEFEQRRQSIVLPPEEMVKLYPLVDLESMNELDLQECAGGACPIK